MTNRNPNRLRLIRSTALVGMGLWTVSAVIPYLHAVTPDDLDVYKLRIDTAWYYSNPTGDIHSAGNGGFIDFTKDLGFNSYSTFAGKVDWKFTRKNHLYVNIIPLDTSRQTVLNRTVVFQGQTFDAGLITNGSLESLAVAPGYQYDIIRRERGHLGVGLQMDLFNTTAKLTAAAQVTGDGMHHNAVSASGSLLAPIPVAGPDVRFYITHSPRVFVDGNLMGMYLFGTEILSPLSTASASPSPNTSLYVRAISLVRTWS